MFVMRSFYLLYFWFFLVKIKPTYTLRSKFILLLDQYIFSIVHNALVFPSSRLLLWLEKTQHQLQFGAK